LDLLDGQTGTLMLGAQVRFLMDYEVSGSMVYTAKPVLGSIREGVQISVVASRGQDPAKVNLKIHVRGGDLRRPVELFRTRLRNNEPQRAIQLAELRVVELRDSVDLPSGGWCVGRIRAAGPGGADQILLMRVLRLPPPRVMKEQPGAAPAPGAPAPGGAGASCGK
jgi:hypothetical protein